MGSDKVRENRARRAADRQGLTLHKSRRRDPRALGYGRYQLNDATTNTVVAGRLNSHDALTLEEVEEHLGITAE
ncbi:hypothetical protein ACO0LV_01905 [Pseudactinotalea sp. Z1739]|uniref:hypothetical protein n=1 Tax=Pseudactinotalea sp. Z1739 TaxID=3413028 RepID=UPI003C7DEA91